MLQSLNKWGKSNLLGNNREGLAVRYCKWPPMSVFIHISCEVMPYFSDVWAVFYTGGWIWWQSEQPGIKKDASSLDTWYSDTFIFNPHDKANFTALLLKVYKLPHQLHDSFFFFGHFRRSPQWIIHTWPLSLRGSQGWKCWLSIDSCCLLWVCSQVCKGGGSWQDTHLPHSCHSFRLLHCLVLTCSSRLKGVARNSTYRARIGCKHTRNICLSERTVQISSLRPVCVCTKGLSERGSQSKRQLKGWLHGRAAGWDCIRLYRWT